MNNKFKNGDRLISKVSYAAKELTHFFVVIETPDDSPYNLYKIYSLNRDTYYSINKDLAEKEYILAPERDEKSP